MILLLVLAGYQMTAVGTSQAFYRALDDKGFDIDLIDIGLPDLANPVKSRMVSYTVLQTRLLCSKF